MVIPMSSSPRATKRAALSPTRAQAFKKCPLQFRFAHVDRIEQVPTAAQVKGTLVHSVLEHLFDVPKAERTMDYAVSTIAPLWAAHLEKNPTDAVVLTETPESQFLSQATSLVETYFQREIPANLEPYAREKFIAVTLDSGLFLRGVVDRIDRNPAGMLRVIDYKTGKMPGPAYQGEALFQLRLYASMIRRTEGTTPARLQMIYLGNNNTLTLDVRDDDVARVEAEVNKIWDDIDERLENRAFEPKPSRLCDWCAFQELCPERGGTAPALTDDNTAFMRTAHDRYYSNSGERDRSETQE